MKRASEKSSHANDQDYPEDQNYRQPQQQRRKVNDSEFSHEESDIIDSFSGSIQDLSAIQSDSGPEHSRQGDNDSDPIISFRSEGDNQHGANHDNRSSLSYNEENILEGLDNWRPSPPALSPSPPPQPLQERIMTTTAPSLQEPAKESFLSHLGAAPEQTLKPWEFTFKGEAPSSPTRRKRRRNTIPFKP
ncbi:hypothetical protein BCR43DRAFT_490130 [Syncephalastrum racemosum]|uniref:Uncharacterized protein n=1 Tax=Syncephalastrum racemosum TaxID=13706 RepID=A0A1X2HFB7_SYNRA|nr:hypothetical protein BCR43DRAFT_490130 [Syncephalastrum racemosum]